MNSNDQEIKQDYISNSDEVDSLNLENLDIEELENRLELAAVAALPPEGCWIFGEF
jgi:hypothetical protein